jgi:nucleoside-diphosphate-sugar epimerase
MNILILGGTGIISGGILRAVKAKGHKVTVFHRGRTRLQERGVTEIFGDRQDRPAFEAMMKRVRFDAVMDVLCFSRADAESAFRAFNGRVRHFIHTSTVCAVGVPTYKVVCDETEPYHPITPYGRGKAEAERFYLGAWKKHRFPVTIIRPSHTYGPGGGWVLGTLLHDWEWDCETLNRIRRGDPVVVHGDGENLWQSCYSDDIGRAYEGALGKPWVRGEVYNACGRDIITWNEHYRRLGEAMGRKAKIVHLPTDIIVAAAPEQATGFLREIAQYHGAYSIDKIRKHIPEFNPRIGVAEGHRRHYQWLKAEGRLKKAPKRPYEDALVRLAARMDREARRLR